MEDLEYFSVLEEGEMVKIDTFDKDPTKVYIIVEHKARVVFLWKGEQARIRLKFIGSRAMGEKRKEVGFHYKIDVNDQGDESRFYKKVMGEEISDDTRGVKVGFVDEVDAGVPSYAEAAAEQGIDVSADEIRETSGSSGPSGIRKMGGLGVKPQKSILAAIDEDGELEPPTPVSKASRAQVASTIHKDNMKEAQQMLSELGKPKGFEREMVVIDNRVYRSKGEDDVVFEDLENPLDGLFMVESYTPRLVCENGRVIAIELLKRTSEEIDETDVAMSQDLEDLTAMFQIEIE
ncbi:MAG: hypothetical protein HeimC2_34730 [Candidatus Heimdallarchaeota archaeon LC_2]|nr:MAG: hypothetical protein HeimC2_34730 [Candidatus Heimdallarchaeota archaeon LC_2]